MFALKKQKNMKKCILIFVIGILFTVNAISQVRRVNIDTFGNFEVIVHVGNGTVVVNNIGEIVAVNMRGQVEYHTSIVHPFLNGKIISIGGTRFEYHTSITHPHLNGRIVRIGDVRFDYHTSLTNSFLNGKIIRIGNTRFEYHTSLVDSFLNGRIVRIGDTRIEYHTSLTDSFLNGKIIRIGNQSFEYHRSIMHPHLNGRLISGNRVVNSGGVTFRLIENYR